MPMENISSTCSCSDCLASVVQFFSVFDIIAEIKVFCFLDAVYVHIIHMKVIAVCCGEIIRMGSWQEY